ncbi:MAG: hypothetical protein OXU67_00220 [Chloroflexota bacterium]|nr:hypothetical protein [Chloroflexota bacterium]
MVERKPPVAWVEGLLDMMQVAFPHGPDDRRRIGFSVGQQTLGLHITRLLLLYAVDAAGNWAGQRDSLIELYGKLSEAQRQQVEAKYKEIMQSEAEWEWDVAQTVYSYLHYLGSDPVGDSLFYWEAGRTHVAEDASIVMAPNTVRRLVYALFIALHGYPSKPITKRYDTAFNSLRESFVRANRESMENTPPGSGRPA